MPAISLPDSIRDSLAGVKVDYLAKQSSMVQQEKPELSVRYLQEAEKIALAEGDTNSIQLARLHMTHFFMNHGLYEEALEKVFAGIELAELSRDSTGQSSFEYYRGRLYSELGEHEKAIASHKNQVYFGRTKENRRGGLAWSLKALGEALMNGGKYAEARDHFQESHDIFTELGSPFDALILSPSLANAHAKLGEFKEARKHIQAVTEQFESFMMFGSHLKSQSILVDILTQENRLKEAKSTALAAMARAQKGNYADTELKLARQMADIGKIEKDYQLALEYTELAHRLEEEAMGDKIKISVAVRDAEYQNLNLQSQNELLEARQKGQKTMTFGLVGGLVLLLLVGLLLLRTNQKKAAFNEILQKKNESLDELNREKDSIMQIVAHDLKSPLTNVSSLSSMLRTTGELTDFQEEILNKMEGSAAAGKELIGNLLELSFIENEEERAKPRNTKLNEELATVIGQHRAAAQKKNIELIAELPQDELSTQTVPEQYRRLVDNLLSNAIKYSPPGKKVWIGLQGKPDRILTEIRDEGPGISPGDQQKMFRKFQKLSARPTAGESSNGLGLAIVKALSEQLKGEIKVESKLGAGSRFIFELPISG